LAAKDAAQEAAQTRTVAAPRIALVLEHPADGLVVGPSACGLLVVGRVGPPELDVVIALDTSVSTAAPSGADVDGDGEVGGPRFRQVGITMGEASSDPDDSVLAAEVAAARRLVERLDPRRTRVALVTFSGGPADLARGEPVLPDASTRVPLSADRQQLAEGLDLLLRETPAGGTHMGAGIDQATIELLGLEGAASRPDPTRARVLVLFTDGTPTRPHGPDRPAENIRAALRAADRAHKARVRIFSVALGPDALARPLAAVEIAARTGGAFLPVRDAGDLSAAMEAIDLTPKLRLELRNHTSGEAARALRQSPDGSFGGFVPLADGANVIEAVARVAGDEGAGASGAEGAGGGAASGAESAGAPSASGAESAGGADGQPATIRTLRVTRDDAAPPPPVPREYDFLDDAVGAYAACLRQLPRVDVSAEEFQRQQIRQQLLLEMERERARAREQAAKQRKEIELDVQAP
jgi:hypothetical protein